MKRAKDGREKMNCFPLKEAVSERLGRGGGHRDLYIYLYNFIGCFAFCVFLFKKNFFFGRDLILAIFYGWLNMKDPNFERKKHVRHTE